MFTGNKINDFIKLLKEGKSVAEAAKKVGIAISTARKQYSLAKRAGKLEVESPEESTTTTEEVEE